MARAMHMKEVKRVIRSVHYPPFRVYRWQVPFAVCLVVIAGTLAAAAGIAIAAGGSARSDVLIGVGVVLAAGAAAAVSRVVNYPAASWVAGLFAALYLLPVDYLPASKQLVSLRIDPVLLLALAPIFFRGREARQGVGSAAAITTVVIGGAMVLLFHYSLAARYYYMSFIIVGAIVYVGVWRGSRDPADLRIILWSIMAAALLASILGIVEFAEKHNLIYGSYYPSAGLNTGGALYFPGTYGYRITSSIGHPLAVAALLLPATVIAVGVYLTERSSSLQRTALAIAACCFVALMMTKSRAAVFVTPAALIAEVLLLRSRPGTTRRVLLLAAGIAVGLVATSSIWSGRFSSSGGAASTEARALGLKYVESVSPKTIPFGLGYGTAQARVGSGGDTISGASAEDGWTELFVDAGPLVMGALIALPLIGGIRTMRRHRDEPYRSIAAVATLAATGFAFTFNGIIVERVVLFTLLALAAVSTPNGDVNVPLPAAGSDWQREKK